MENQAVNGPSTTNHSFTSDNIRQVKKPDSTENLFSIKLPRKNKFLPTSKNGTLKLHNGNSTETITNASGNDQHVNEASSSAEQQQKDDVASSFQTFVLTKAMRIRFYRNGDQYFPGIVLTVSLDHYRTMDALYERLNRVLADSTTLPHGVRYIFTIDGLKMIKSVEQLQSGHGYVCSSTEVYKPLNYLTVRQPMWCSNASRPPPVCPVSLRTFVKEPNDFVYPKIITIIRNGIKPRKVVRVLLNKKTALSFEQVMQEITALVNLNSGVVKKLLTLNKREVLRLADFFGEESVFIAYGIDKVHEEDFSLADDEARRLFYTAKKTFQGKMRLPLRNESINRRRDSLMVLNKAHLPELPSSIDSMFELLKVLGDGNTAIVYEAQCKTTGHRRALKVISEENHHALKEFVTIELNLMSRMDCDHIVRMFDYWNVNESIYISLELVPEGDLFEYLRSLPFTEENAASLIFCLASALNYLHMHNIVHRDVKPENLLVYIDENGLPCLKLADFGLAAVLDDEGAVLYEVCGTPTYVAPEVLAELGYGTKVDIWSAGVILYVLLCGFPPFMSMEGNRDALFEMIMGGQFEFPSLVWGDKSYSVKALILGMLSIDVEERHSAADVLDYDWVKNRGSVNQEFEKAAQLYYQVRVQRDSDMEPNSVEGSSREIYYSRRASMDELKSTRDDASIGDSDTSSFTAGYSPSR